MEKEELSSSDAVVGLRDSKNEKSEEQIRNSIEAEVVPANEKPDEEPQYVTGIKLGMALFSTTIVAFLMMLDLAIIVTVSETLGSVCIALTHYQPRQFPV